MKAVGQMPAGAAEATHNYKGCWREEEGVRIKGNLLLAELIKESFQINSCKAVQWLRSAAQAVPVQN